MVFIILIIGLVVAYSYFGILGVGIPILAFLIFAYFLGNKDRKGFIVMMSGNSCWIAMGFLVGSIGLIIANSVFFAMNTRGLLKWSQHSK